MELVYLWVDKYKNIEKQGFNFSPRFTCKYKDGELTIDKKEHVSIFPENINVTAIVGENGSGKSSILEILQKIFIFNPIMREDVKDLNYLLITSINKTTLNIFSNISNIDYSSEQEIIIKKRDDILFENLDYLFYDASLPYNKYNRYDVANNNFVYEQDFNVLKEHHYIDLEIFKISEKLLYLINNKIEFDFFKPIGIKINLKKEKNINRDFFVYDFHGNKRFPIDFRNLVDAILDEDLGINEVFLFNVLLSYCDVFERNNFKNNLNIIKNDKKNRISNMIKILDRFYQSEEFKKTLEKYGSLYSKKTLDEINELCKIVEINKLDIESLLKYKDYIDIELLDNKQRNFSSLSHGEKVNFAIQIYISFDVLTSNQNMFYILDEPDLSLHPEWQKKYLALIMNYCEQFKQNIHILLTSHSPFLLSDIPKENIIFLDKYTEEDKEVKNGIQKIGNCKNMSNGIDIKQTFGANIHTLLSHSFFMKDGLMGEFAKGKITAIKDFYEKVKNSKNPKNEHKQEFENNIENFKHIQSIIGEPFLKTIMKNYLDELEILFYGKKEFLDKEINRLEKLRESLDDKA